VETGGLGSIEAFCSWESAGVRYCEGGYGPDSNQGDDVVVQMTATFTNVAMGLRALDMTRIQVRARDDPTGSPWIENVPVSYRAEMNDGSTSGKPRGSVTIRAWATLPNLVVEGWGWLAIYEMRIDRRVIADHAVVNPDHPTFGWFVRNEWFRLTLLRGRAIELARRTALRARSCELEQLPARSTIRARATSARCSILAGRSLTNPGGRPNGNPDRLRRETRTRTWARFSSSDRRDASR
jgi:hypothetical protein